MPILSAVSLKYLIYRAHALSLESRVQFAGDAARLVPIFGVRGANSMAPPSFAAYAPSATQPRREALRLRSLIRQSAAISYVDSPLNSATERSAEFRAGPQPGAVPLECPLGGLPDGSRRLWHSILPRPALFPKNSKPSLLPGAKSMTPKSPVSGAGEQKIPSAGVLEIDG
jgi:hypothetical protein